MKSQLHMLIHPRRRPDWVSNIYIKDPSYGDEFNTFPVLIFSSDPNKLPHATPGDILRIHRAKYQCFNNKPQLTGKIGYQFHFVLFPKGPSGNFEPKQKSSEHFTMDQSHDNEIIAALRAWNATSVLPLHPAAQTHQQYLRKIRDVLPETFFDCIALVLGSDLDLQDRMLRTDAHLKAIYIWDGTDAKPYSYTCDFRNVEGFTAQEEMMEMTARQLPLDNCLTADTLPSVGTAMPLVFNAKRTIEIPQVGHWIKLRNVSAKVVQGQLQGYYTEKSKWSLVQDTTLTIEVASSHRQGDAMKTVSEWAPAPYNFLSITPQAENVPLVTIRSLLADVTLVQPTNYRLLVRILDYNPKIPEGMAVKVGEKWSWALKVLVEDATGRLDVLLMGQQANECFCINACDLIARPEVFEGVTGHLMAAMGKNEGDDESVAWLPMCVQSHFKDPANPWTSRSYRVFSTRFL